MQLTPQFRSFIFDLPNIRERPHYQEDRFVEKGRESGYD
jgi:hypothetical protein